MRKEYGAAVRKQFQKRISQILPQFALVKGEKNTAPGAPLYRYSVAEDLAFYIYLALAGLHDKFTVEIAWSRDGHFPEPVAFANPRDESKESGLCFRLCLLWNLPDYWWIVEPSESTARLIQRAREWDYSLPPAEEFLPNIPIALDDVFAKIEEYAIPYFQEIAAKRGYRWPEGKTD